MDQTSTPRPVPGSGTADALPEHDNNTVSAGTIWPVITASSVGTVIEWYDFYIFGSLAAIIGPVLFGQQGDLTKSLLGALAIFGAGFVVRPFGAVFFGRIGDLIGRKYTFLVTLLIMGGATFVTGNTAGPPPTWPSTPRTGSAATSPASSRLPPPAA
jgi:MFS family permease